MSEPRTKPAHFCAQIRKQGQDVAIFEIPPINMKTVNIRLIGTTSLIVHAWSEKAKAMIRDKQAKKAKQLREARNPNADYEDSLYYISKGKNPIYGFPVIAFKAAAVTACTSLADITKVAARQAFHIDGELNDAGEQTDLARIIGTPRMREDMVRISMGTADIRYRGEFSPWSVELAVKYNANLLSAEQIASMFDMAGFAVGVGEWRPEKDGNNGRFQVDQSTGEAKS